MGKAALAAARVRHTQHNLEASARRAVLQRQRPHLKSSSLGALLPDRKPSIGMPCAAAPRARERSAARKRAKSLYRGCGVSAHAPWRSARASSAACHPPSSRATWATGWRTGGGPGSLSHGARGTDMPWLRNEKAAKSSTAPTGRGGGPAAGAQPPERRGASLRLPRHQHICTYATNERSLAETRRQDGLLASCLL